MAIAAETMPETVNLRTAAKPDITITVENQATAITAAEMFPETAVNPVIIIIIAENQATAITAAEMLPETAELQAELQTAVKQVITITAERQTTAIAAAETQLRNSRYRLRNSRYRTLLKAAEKLLVQMNNK